MTQYAQAFRRYIEFGSRSTRREFWMFVLVQVLVVVLLESALLFNTFVVGNSALVMLSLAVLWAYAVVTLVPSLALSVRRLHDTGKSAWSLLWGLIPFVGGIIMIVFMCQPSDESRFNSYGPRRDQ